MNKIINGVASEYDMPMKYENKTTTIFIDTQDMEERYGEQLYQEYLEKENKELKQKVNQLETNWNELKKELNTLLEMGGFNSYGITCALGCIHKIEDRCSNE